MATAPGRHSEGLAREETLVWTKENATQGVIRSPDRSERGAHQSRELLKSEKHVVMEENVPRNQTAELRGGEAVTALKWLREEKVWARGVTEDKTNAAKCEQASGGEAIHSHGFFVISFLQILLSLKLFSS